NTKIFSSRNDQRVGCLVEMSQFAVCHPTTDIDVLRGYFAQPTDFRTGTHNHQLAVETFECFDDQIDPLISDESAGRQIKAGSTGNPADCGWLEEGGVHGRMNNLRIASIVLANAFANESRVRDEMMHAATGLTIPLLHRLPDTSHREATNGTKGII